MMKRLIGLITLIGFQSQLAHSACVLNSGNNYKCLTADTVPANAPNGSVRWNTDGDREVFIKHSGSWDLVSSDPTSHTHVESDVTNLVSDLSGKEASLGNPGVSGYVLASTDAGVRSWVANGSGSMIYPGSGVAVSTGSGWDTSLNLTGITDSISTTSSTLAASAAAVKAAYDLANGKEPANANIQSHISNTSNPHSITYSQVGAAPISHAHAEGDVTNLITDLAGKASSTHTHAESDVTNLTADLSSKEPGLGNPGVTGYVLASTTGGVRSWVANGGSSMVYPGSGIANSTGSAWGTSYSTSGTGTVIPLTAGPTFTGTLTVSAVTTSSSVINTPCTKTCSHTGTAIDLTCKNVELSTDGDGDQDNCTLANGTVGQELDLIWKTQSSATDGLVITPGSAFADGATTYTFSMASPTNVVLGRSLSLVYTTNGWVKTGQSPKSFIVRPTSTYTNSTTTPSSITGMSFSADANKAYSWRCLILENDSNAVSHIRYNMTGPTSPTYVAINYLTHGTSLTSTSFTGVQAFSAAAQSTAGTSSVVTGTKITNIDGFLVNGVNSGTVQLQASGSGAQTSTVYPVSYCEVQLFGGN